MADIVGVVALSHSPFWDLSFDVKGTGEKFVSGVRAARAKVAELKPDALVIFGPDHFRNFFYDLLPAFCIGLGEIEGFGEYGSPKGPMRCATALASDIFRGVTDNGFDPACSLRMGIDHGLTQPYVAVDPNLTAPIVPIMVNAAGAPRPGLERCYRFGEAVGQATRNSDSAKRVVVVASGGLSHWTGPLSVDNPNLTPEVREHVIGGRTNVVEYSAKRDVSLADRKAQGDVGRVNEEWDKWFLKCVESRDYAPIFAQDPVAMEVVAGNGSHEVRSWLGALGAWNRPLNQVTYEAVPRWATGMGCVLGY
jgi:2,3-dihydroxyphenylpropionate 1,2-dioxygenase